MKRKVPYLKLFLPRRRGIAVRLAVLSLVLAAITAAWCLADLTSQVLVPPQPILALDHYAINRSLKSYLDNISVLIEPSITVCSDSERVELLVLVTSSPKRFVQRQAIRDTWGKHVPAYFVLGLDGVAVEDLTADNYLEAKEYSDMIIFQFQDHYQNLTLKTALMMQWTAARCPSHLDELMLFKTDDDVLVNPWLLRRVVRQNSGKDLVGYRKMNSYLHRDAYNKWFVPRWLHRPDLVPQYLSGTGYLIRGSRLEEILQAAFEIPIINLEDVYFTYIVSKFKLNLTLTHDRRLSPYKPWLPLDCIYWGLGSMHSLTSNEMLGAWPSIERLGKKYEQGFENCRYFVVNIWTELFLC
ncbi:beta-1,3-galactosyltransferase 5-like [Maniola hyperantus]|uniref:beta-1,3-galactosyltransferase 5-like n=1 Tax=Aphantopus hyperantus TaxID=2795564 RepID=UPI001569107E|nr:beta-1,3-galactosyltransferase 5-like [Maniola hyperantus]